MKNINEVISSKEAQIQQLEKELETLRAAASLLAESGDEPAVTAKAAQAGGSAVRDISKRWP